MYVQTSHTPLMINSILNQISRYDALKAGTRFRNYIQGVTGGKDQTSGGCSLC